MRRGMEDAKFHALFENVNAKLMLLAADRESQSATRYQDEAAGMNQARLILGLEYLSLREDFPPKK